MTLRNTEPRADLRSMPTRSPASLPPPELREAFPELHAACNELERLRGERRDVRQSLTRATSERRAAEHNDIRAAAENLRAGKADPGSPMVDRVDAEIRDLTRRESILNRAIESAEADLNDAITAHRAEWVAATNAAIGKRRKALRKAAETWGELRHQVGSTESLVHWLEQWPTRPSWTPGNTRMASYGPEGSRLANGPSYTETLDALLYDADGPRDNGPRQVTLSDEAA